LDQLKKIQKSKKSPRKFASKTSNHSAIAERNACPPRAEAAEFWTALIGAPRGAQKSKIPSIEGMAKNWDLTHAFQPRGSARGSIRAPCRNGTQRDPPGREASSFAIILEMIGY
jgi:hypothetical protein